MLDDLKVTEEAETIKAYIEQKWSRLFCVKLEVPLKQVFNEPENSGLKHIWRYGSADLVVFRGNKPVAIIEPGGAHHFDEKQSLNDRRKWKLAEQNGVRCLHVMNDVMDSLSKRKWRALIGSFLFPRKERVGTLVDL
ncbi:MAG: hypothetical protein WDM80_12820 [Limisphaerales bacterium]